MEVQRLLLSAFGRHKTNTGAAPPFPATLFPAVCFPAVGKKTPVTGRTTPRLRHYPRKLSCAILILRFAFTGKRVSLCGVAALRSGEWMWEVKKSKANNAKTKGNRSFPKPPGGHIRGGGLGMKPRVGTPLGSAGDFDGLPCAAGVTGAASEARSLREHSQHSLALSAAERDQIPAQETRDRDGIPARLTE